MFDAISAFALLGAIAATSIGAARLVSWVLDRRDRTAVARIREQAFVAQARAELAATGWTPDQEALYQAELAAIKRGDLLAAARYTERQDRAA